jgi:hypothetical protein
MGLLPWLLVGGVVLALAIGGYLFLVYRQNRSREEPYLHFRCPGCKRRLRFRARQSMHAGQCSHCGAKLTFPPPSQCID